ncbi:AIPR family protein [Sulfurimonas sp.]
MSKIFDFLRKGRGVFMISLEEFHQDFLQSILSDAQSRGIMKPQAFFENVCEELISIGDLTPNYTYAEFQKRGMEVFGYDFDDERKVLSLLVHQFFQEDTIETLTQGQIDTKFKRLNTFFEKSINGLYKDLEEAYESYSMAFNIYKWYKEEEISKVRLLILSDGKATRNLQEIPNSNTGSVEVEYRIIDINYLYKVFLSQNNSIEFEITDIELPALLVDTNSDNYKSYLTYMNGLTIAKIYDKFGQKLLEQNVRTFLQFRGKVNKGLRNTIEFNPEMFFAYNNGLTVTATDVVVENGNIVNIKNLQIVNGGQTTSAIYAAWKNGKLDVSKINVQIKLSVVLDKNKKDEFVSKVSEYANTQNKVNKSDFFSNSPFHKEFKDYSKRVWAPVKSGSQQRTHWFYERVRGEYLNEQAYLTKAQKKQFQIENPKSQMIDKTFLAKSENVWQEIPYIVSKGAQYSFDEFARQVTKKLEENNLAITEKYFKDAIAKVIIFKETERIVSNASWYNGGYRAQTVAYILSYISHYIKLQKKYMNFEVIWEKQELPKRLKDIICQIGDAVYQRITHPPDGNANVGQWCKKTLCWDDVKKININFEIDEFLIDSEEIKIIKKEDKKLKKLDNDIEIQSFVVKLDKSHWNKILDYFSRSENKNDISPMQYDILNKYVKGYLPLPSIKQSKHLYDIYVLGIDEGVPLGD